MTEKVRANPREMGLSCRNNGVKLYSVSAVFGMVKIKSSLFKTDSKLRPESCKSAGGKEVG